MHVLFHFFGEREREREMKILFDEVFNLISMGTGIGGNSMELAGSAYDPHARCMGRGPLINCFLPVSAQILL